MTTGNFQSAEATGLAKPKGLPGPIFWSLAAIFCLTFAAESSLHDSALIDIIPATLRIAGVTVGLAIGFWLGYLLSQASDGGRPLRKIVGVITIPAFGAVAGSYYTRTGYEVYAFAGVEPVHYQQIVEVTAIGSKYRFNASGRARGGTRNISVPIDGTLYANLEPYRHPGRDCVVLSGEIGRHGVRRVRVPTILFDTPVSIEQWRSCSDDAAG